MEEGSYHRLPERGMAMPYASAPASSYSAGTGITRSTRLTPPAHYTLKIESYSILCRLLSKLEKENYKSPVFEAGAHKWRLSLYPEGDKKRNGDGFISMYLLLADVDNLPLGLLDINVDFRFFVYDQIRDKYLTVQDGEGRQVRRFHRTKREDGFSQLIALSTFKEASNGYLVNDSCEFGVEVFVLEKRSKGVCLQVLREPDDWYFTWNIPDFSTLPQGDHFSTDFSGGGRNWKLRINLPAGQKHLSLFLRLADCTDQHQKSNNFGILLQMLREYTGKILENSSHSKRQQQHKLYVGCKLRIVNQINGNHMEDTIFGGFSESTFEWGFRKFTSLSDIHDQSKGYLVNDNLIIQSKFEVICVAKKF